MVQFYFLSIVTNLLSGLILSGEYLEGKQPGLSSVREFFSSKPGVRIAIGTVTFITGFLKLLTVTGGDVPVVGDLLPALSGLILGAGVLFERYRESSTVTSPLIETGEKVLLKRKNFYGIVGLVVALVHFLLPRVLFL